MLDKSWIIAAAIAGVGCWLIFREVNEETPWLAGAGGPASADSPRPAFAPREVDASTYSRKPETRGVTRGSGRQESTNAAHLFLPSSSHGIPGRAAVPRETGPYQTPRAAASVDLGLTENETAPGFDSFADSLAADLQQAADPLESAADLQAANIMASAIADADFRMRQLYGGHVWMRHHIHAHHMAAGQLPAQP